MHNNSMLYSKKTALFANVPLWALSLFLVVFLSLNPGVDESGNNWGGLLLLVSLFYIVPVVVVSAVLFGMTYLGGRAGEIFNAVSIIFGAVAFIGILGML